MHYCISLSLGQFNNALQYIIIIFPPPQVNLEYLARVVFGIDRDVLYPDSVVGTDSHTTMINGLGVVGWGKAPPTKHNH